MSSRSVSRADLFSILLMIAYSNKTNKFKLNHYNI